MVVYLVILRDEEIGEELGGGISFEGEEVDEEGVLFEGEEWCKELDVVGWCCGELDVVERKLKILSTCTWV